MTTALAIDSRDSWLAARRLGIGGSDAAAVMGVSPWKSTYALWAEKAGVAPVIDEETDAMRWGKRLEGVIAEEYGDVTKRKVRLNGAGGLQLIQHPGRPYMLGTIDADVVSDHRPDPGILEVKTTGAHRAEEWEEAAPLLYQVQLQHYMACTGRQWGSFAVLIGGQKFHWYDVERNDKFIASLEARCEWFWGLVEKGEAPPIDGSESTADALKAIYPGDSGEAIELPSEAIQWVHDLAVAKERIAGLESSKRTIENQIRAAMGSATFGAVLGLGKFSLKTQQRAAHQVAASEFRALRWSPTKEKR